MGGRPTLLWALALEGLPEDAKKELHSLAANIDSESFDTTIARVRHLYQQAGVFDKARRLVDKHQERAEAVADELESEDLRRLFYYLIETVLDRGKSEPQVSIVSPELPIMPSVATS